MALEFYSWEEIDHYREQVHYRLVLKDGRVIEGLAEEVVMLSLKDHILVKEPKDTVPQEIAEEVEPGFVGRTRKEVKELMAKVIGPPEPGWMISSIDPGVPDGYRLEQWSCKGCGSYHHLHIRNRRPIEALHALDADGEELTENGPWVLCSACSSWQNVDDG